MSPLAPTNCLDHPSWIKKFMSELEKPHRDFLVDCGISPLNTNLLDTDCSYWNPRTNTFFFWVGEMSILLEGFFAYRYLCKDLGINNDGGNRTALADGPLSFEHALYDKLKGDADYDEVIRNWELNLKLLWAKYKHWIKSDKPSEQASIRRVALLLAARVFIFTTCRYKLLLHHVKLFFNHIAQHKWSLLQPVLAYLMQWLSSFVDGDELFGSPYLLQLWFKAHFKGTVGISLRQRMEWPLQSLDR